MTNEKCKHCGNDLQNKPSEITITVSGERASGKTLIIKLLTDYLNGLGIQNHVELDQFHTTALRQYYTGPLLAKDDVFTGKQTITFVEKTND